MSPNRLWVDEIVSIGLVKAGDNEEAEVMIYKSYTPPSITFADTLNQITEAKTEALRAAFQKAREETQPMSNTPITDNLTELLKAEPDGTFTETIKVALDKWAGSQARERHIAPRYGDLQRTRAEIMILAKAEFWDSTEGKALKQLDRAYGSSAASLVLGKIRKSGNYADGFAALEYLAG